jgi:hypothetical protein
MTYRSKCDSAKWIMRVVMLHQENTDLDPRSGVAHS